jgi:hypothetical protein
VLLSFIFLPNSFIRSRSRLDIANLSIELVLKLFTDSKDFFLSRVNITRLKQAWRGRCVPNTISQTNCTAASRAGSFAPKGSLDEMPMMAALFLGLASSSLVSLPDKKATPVSRGGFELRKSGDQ